ncbi:peptidylprolyl isomerase [Flavobacterium sp. J49]|uniref:peptidylprolyl isomerase n=1 Tax=Flavobacterium sp. J49 TaxID=2718534 RepID=UPI0015938D27|nr:peptidylprolyl isomerase [Flavobacterium sp. J49]MBF6641036.1 peptidylprolyl isomerase [Flavobacterium sp. J49]NIC02283.1 peptidylprolyl isomerase [Flavobacterium sp. J49]
MPLKTKIMKFINSQLAIAFIAAIFTVGTTNAQEIIKDSVKTKPQAKTAKKVKVDGIIATVGDYIILDSDIDKSFLELSSQGQSVKDITRCQMLGKLLEEKLYAHQAIQDSIVIKDEEVKEKMNEQIAYMVEQLSSMENVIKYFKKDSEEDFRSELFDIIKTNKLTTEMRNKIVNAVEITPEETRNFFKSIPQDELPVFGAEMEVAQIVITPKITEEEKQRVINRLKEIKAEVLAGSSFKTRAVIYSDDRGSSSNGGFYKINRKTQFVKEFKDVAFSLGEGEISEPFETEYGYHIIMVEKIKGQEVELRHILMMPKVSDQALKEAREKIITIKNKIESGEISFAEAARTMSDEKETRANGGTLINPKTQDTHFELTKMDPSLYSEVSNLKDKAITSPILDDDPRTGKKYKIITVTNRINEHTADYGKDYIKIKDLALKEKQIKAIGKWSEEKIKETYVKINGEYQDCLFINNWLKK